MSDQWLCCDLFNTAFNAEPKVKRQYSYLTIVILHKSGLRFTKLFRSTSENFCNFKIELRTNDTYKIGIIYFYCS